MHGAVLHLRQLLPRIVRQFAAFGKELFRWCPWWTSGSAGEGKCENKEVSAKRYADKRATKPSPETQLTSLIEVIVGFATCIAWDSKVLLYLSMPRHRPDPPFCAVA